MDVPMMDIAEGLKNVTVVEMKALIFRNTPPIRAPATGCSHVSSNFKKFRKVCYPLLCSKVYGDKLFSFVPLACSKR